MGSFIETAYDIAYNDKNIVFCNFRYNLHIKLGSYNQLYTLNPFIKLMCLIKDEKISNKREFFIDQYYKYKDIIQPLFCLCKHQDTCFELLNICNFIFQRQKNKYNM